MNWSGWLESFGMGAKISRQFDRRAAEFIASKPHWQLRCPPLPDQGEAECEGGRFHRNQLRIIIQHEFGPRMDATPWHSRCRSGRKLRAILRARRSKREQGGDRCDAAASAERHQCYGAGFALASSQSQAGAGAFIQRHRRSSTKTSRVRDREARKRASPQIAASTCAQKENSGIETQAR